MWSKLLCIRVADAQPPLEHTLWTSTCLGFNLKVNHLSAWFSIYLSAKAPVSLRKHEDSKDCLNSE